jgi:hypothetical protein
LRVLVPVKAAWVQMRPVAMQAQGVLVVLRLPQAQRGQPVLREADSWPSAIRRNRHPPQAFWPRLSVLEQEGEPVGVVEIEPMLYWNPFGQ